MEYVVIMNRIPELIAKVEAVSRAAPKRFADTVLNDARGAAPVATGALRDSGYATSIESGKSAEIGFSVDYAAYVEYGTYKMAAQPFLGPAFAAHEEAFIAEMRAAVNL